MVAHHAPIMKHEVLKHGWLNQVWGEHLRSWKWVWLMHKVGIGRGRNPGEKLKSWVCNTLKHSPIDKARNLLLHLLQRRLELLHLGHTHPIHGPCPPHLGLGFLVHEIELIGALPLMVKLVVDLSELYVEVMHVGHAVGLDDLHGAGVRRWGPCEIAVNDGIHVGVAKGKHLLTRRENNERHVSTTESAKLTGFLEKPVAALGECDLKVALVAHFLHLDLLAATAFLWARHGGKRKNMRK